MKRVLPWLLVAMCAGALLVPLGAFADVEDDVDDLIDRVDELELKTAKNKIAVFGDFRVRYDYTNWHIPTYYQFMGMNFNQTPDPRVFMKMPAQELDNSEAWSARLRLKLDAKVGKDVHFTGRLNMHRGFGAGSVPLFNGFPNTVLSAFNSSAVPTDNLLRVERAAFTWDPKWAPLFITAGRQAATGGPPRELREDRVRQGTPGALMIDAEIDGFMLGMHLGELGLPEEAVIRLCYGTGFEAGFGTGGATKQTVVTIFAPDITDPNNPGLFAQSYVIKDLKDSKVAGICGETSIPAIPGRTLFSFGYFKMLDMTDIPSAMTRGFPNVMSTQDQTLTATDNLGDMDLYGVCFQHGYTFESGYELDWFGSFAANKSHPEEGTQSLYGFGPLLGNDKESQTGSAFFAGVRGDIPATGGKLGLEFNHGSENWFAYLPAADDVNGKLATRGDVFEGYYIQPLNEDGLNLRVGYQMYDYSHAFSGWHISPMPIENFELSNEPFTPYPYPDEIQNLYVILDLSF